MFLDKLFSGKSGVPAKVGITDPDELAAILRTRPDVMEAFEKAYATQALTEVSDNFFDVNSRQAAEQMHEAANLTQASPELEAMIDKIVGDLAAQTSVYVFDGNLSRVEQQKLLPSDIKDVTNDDIKALPETLRPQLTGTMMKRDINADSCDSILWSYSNFLKESDPKKKATFYHMFRQGLDILDLDPITYEIIGTNRTSMGHWLPQLVAAARGKDFFRIPATRIAKVPMTLLQLTRQDYGALTPTTLKIVDDWTHRVFALEDDKDYFIKTGTYSSKFDFRNAKVSGAKEVRELGEYLLYIHFQALQMASPLSTPCIYGASTTNEWVVREFIADKENNPCIYKGLPLHTEYRVFIDADTDSVLSCVSYWDPDTMKRRFRDGAGNGSMHDAHDYLIYKAHEDTLMKRYEDNKDAVVEHVKELLPDLDLHGQWSLDIMQNGDDFWLIDMGVAENSAFYESVPAELRSPFPEDWIPKLEAPKTA